MVERKVQITHIDDHEFELATMVVQTAGRYNSVISIIMDNKRVNAKSIMGMMTLGLMEDDEVVVTADGADEAEALESMTKLLNR
ncbi:MAG: HPr family phosphocarrier protein [Firmicutes bacterium]|nr:HPr family phosphocarrier protein [Bacillota bacterium]